MGQKCRKYRKARKNGIIAAPKRDAFTKAAKNKSAFKVKCKNTVPNGVVNNLQQPDKNTGCLKCAAARVLGFL